MKQEVITWKNGPRERVLLLTASVFGIGDVIHAMPVVWQMIQDGLQVTVNCRPFVNYLWESIGATVTNIREPLGLAWAEENENTYGAWYQPNEWNYKWEDRDRFDAFASEMIARVPERFSWIDILQPRKTDAAYTVFAPESAHAGRTLPRAQLVRDGIPGEVVWLTQGSRLPSLEQWRKVESVAADVLHHNTGITSETLVQLREQEARRLKGKTLCEDIQNLLSVVYSAEHVIAVESAVAAIAAAFAKPLTVYCGMTGHKNTIGQFQRFHPGWTYEAREDAMDSGVYLNAITSVEKLNVMRELMNTKVPGAVAEVGVYKGGAARLLAREFKGRDCYFFDTFEGMPFSDYDDVHPEGEFADTSLASVQALLSDCPNAHCIKGTFPKSAKKFRDKTFSFVYLDGDQYQTTRDGLAFFWPRLATGGIIALDDYKWPNCPGVEKALNEFGKKIYNPIPFFAYLEKD